MSAKLKAENGRFSLESIKDRARRAAEKAESHSGARVIGNSTVVVTYNGSKSVSSRQKMKYKHQV